MIRLRSIWLRQILLQVLFICMLWGAFSFYFLTVWHDRAFQTLDNQLSIICRGVAGLYDNQAITAASVPADSASAPSSSRSPPAISSASTR